MKKTPNVQRPTQTGSLNRRKRRFKVRFGRTPKPTRETRALPGSELVVLVFEQDVERGERSVTTRDILLQVELVSVAQFAWHAVASAKEGRSRSPSVRELADYSESLRFRGRMSRAGLLSAEANCPAGCGVGGLGGSDGIAAAA
jgi:hypothetical protein